MKTVTIEKDKVVIEVTAADMAKAFWSMDSELQAQFFDQLGAVIEEDHKTNSSAYSYGVSALVEALDRIANLPMNSCSTENDYRLSAAKAIALAAVRDFRKAGDAP